MISPHAIIGAGTEIGAGSDVWHFANLEEDVTVGAKSVIGSHAYIGRGAVIGKGVHIQSFAFICRNAAIEDNVFVGPHVVLADDKTPRAGNRLYSPQPPRLCAGCSIGAGAIILPGIVVGENAMIGAGAVVTRDVPGNVTVLGLPARQREIV